MDNSILKYLIISLVVVLLFGFFAYQKAEAPTQEEVTINQEKVEFEQFNSDELGISIKAPTKAQVSHEQERLKVIYTQQENMATEVTDGFSLFINNENLEESLSEFVQDKFEGKTENLKSISEPEKINEDRYIFQVENGLGGTQNYEVFLLGENAITVSYSIANPNNYDYETAVNQIVNSIEING